MKKWKSFKEFVSNSNQFVYLYSLLKTSLFRACVKEAVVFTFLILSLILVNILDPRKYKICYNVLVFC